MRIVDKDKNYRNECQFNQIANNNIIFALFDIDILKVHD